MKSRSVDIVTPQSIDDLASLRAIFQEYAASLSIDLSFENFEHELAWLPGEYAPPRGALLMAIVDAQVAGCCALRPFDTADISNACEMKRLYVRPAYRGLGLGRLLAEASMDAARQYGYSHILLDTLDEMEAARSLYEELGFVEIPPYYHNPIARAHHLKARL